MRMEFNSGPAVYRDDIAARDVKRLKVCSTVIVIYLDFHSTRRALWLLDSWSRALDQIQIYPDRADQDTIPQLLPSQLFVCFAMTVEGKV